MDKNRAGRYHCVPGHLRKALPLAIFVAASLLVQSCDRGLSHGVLRDIEWEKNDWQAASRTVDASVKLVEGAITTSPELFQGSACTGSMAGETTGRENETQRLRARRP
jgi:hypothetical protein